MRDWTRTLVGPDVSLLDALAAIDASGLQIAMVVDSARRLLGVVTDGDVRRFILAHGDMKTSVSEFMNRSPMTADSQEDRHVVLSRMKAKNFHHMPVVDRDGTVAGLATVDDLLRSQDCDNLVVIMAGGLGLRLRPLTLDCPKPMLRVGNRPILETTILQLIEYGFRRFAISVNYLADAIIQHFGDGSRLGVRIEYLRESAPMGTAGALAQLHERPSLPFLLVNGDVLTKLNFRSLLDFHNTHGAPMTVCVREYSYSIPYGVVMVRGDVLEQLEEKPSRQALVNAGIYVCDPEVLDFVERGNPTNATDIIAALVARQKYPQAFPIHEYWLDIGHHQDFSRAAAEFPTIFAGDAA